MPAAILAFRTGFEAVADATKAANYWTAIERLRRRAERRWEVRCADQLQRDTRRLMRRARNAHHPGELQVLAEQAARETVGEWETLIAQLHADVARDIAPRVASALKHQKDIGDEFARALGGEPSTTWEGVVDRWLRDYGAIRARNLSEHALAAVRRAVRQGVAEGWGIPKIADAIVQSAGLGAGRAVVIARTEVVAASNLAARAGAIDTGLELNHSWLATPGPRTRPAHARASGQTRPLDEPFIVGGERLMFPGDSSLGASAKNVIQCRCTVTFLPVDFA